ncbi:hypothetical protein ACHQM5_026139 [Ranunculus cassubicifolius]
MEQERKRRKVDEDEKVERFYALIRSTRDLRNHLLATGSNKDPKKGKNKMEEVVKPVWIPKFEWEDFMISPTAATTKNIVAWPSMSKREGKRKVDVDKDSTPDLCLKLSL